ncbi:MAG TPA: SDR family NAD(P)-dependent oxidoreductase [Thermoanaerobaculia bacterium]|nr:SDR family NAD(P)-dependent oxidoreductase [Thermoanaerobaculia bacterium]
MKRAIITGASSGIGLELSRELVRRGWAVAMLARRTDLIADAARSLSNSVAVTCDVTDGDAVVSAVRQSEGELGGPFDLAVANAGIGYPTHAAKFDANAAAEIIRVNVIGMLHLFGAVVPSMIERRSGRFAGVASVAGHRGLPTVSAYSSSKAAMQTFLEASRVELAPYGVGVSIVNPGFIVTAMTAKNRFRMPFLMKVEPAAKRIADGLERGKRVIEFPLPMSIFTRAMRYVPDAIYDVMMIPAARRQKKS